MALITDSLRFILRSSPHLLLRFISFLPWVLAFSFLLSFPPSLILSFLFSYSVLSLSLSLLPPSLFLLASFPLSLCFIFPFPSLFSMRSTLSHLLSLSLSLLFTCLLLRVLLSLSLSLSWILPYSSIYPFPCLLIHPFSSLFLILLLLSFSLPVSPPTQEHFPLSSLESTLSVYACRSLLPSPSL